MNSKEDLKPVFSHFGAGLRFFLVCLGSFFPNILHQHFEALLNYFYVGKWLAARKLWPKKWVYSKRQVLAEALKPFENSKVNYMEFGVFHGESMRFVSNFLKHPETNFYGFDAFEGLPETWNEVHPLRSLTVDNRVPKFDDKRIQLVIGYFQQTLARFELKNDAPIIVNIDSDLHSSAQCVLEFIKSRMNKVAAIYFDEFNHKHHELRAFQDFLVESKISTETLVADRTASYIVFKFSGPTV